MKKTKGRQLQGWAENNEPDVRLIYKKGYWEQIILIRDEIIALLARSSEEHEKILSQTKVISAHISKSVLLPVYRIELDDGTTFTMRNNFHNWKVSVNSYRKVDADFMGLFPHTERISSVYCEGFPEECVYGPYAENNRQFTLELHSDYNLFTFFWIFARSVLGTR